jgi:TPR repeat protein
VLVGGKQITVCPFCGAYLALEVTIVLTLSEALEEIISQFGLKVMDDGKQLVYILSDVAPGLKKERNMLNAFYACRGNVALNASLDANDYLLEKNKIIMRMEDEWGASEENADYVCDSFFAALGGTITTGKPKVNPIAPKAVEREIEKFAQNPTDVEERIRLGNEYRTEDGVLRRYLESMDPGHANPQFFTGDFYHMEGNEEKAQFWYKEAERLYRKAANEGDPAAQEKLGECYQDGKGLIKNYEKAVFWFSRAASGGNVLAQKLLSDCYDRGEGVSQDHNMALQWMEEAANQGDTGAQNYLGNCYNLGFCLGVGQDYLKAVDWFKKSASQGNSWAQEQLGWCFYLGHGVQQDYLAAEFWQKKSADQGGVDSQDRLKDIVKKIQKCKDNGRCQHCGGKFIGLFTKRCGSCGKLKDY